MQEWVGTPGVGGAALAEPQDPPIDQAAQRHTHKQAGGSTSFIEAQAIALTPCQADVGAVPVRDSLGQHCHWPSGPQGLLDGNAAMEHHC